MPNDHVRIALAQAIRGGFINPGAVNAPVVAADTPAPIVRDLRPLGIQPGQLVLNPHQLTAIQVARDSSMGAAASRAIRAKFVSLGGAGSALGLPIRAKMAMRDEPGKRIYTQSFRGGEITTTVNEQDWQAGASNAVTMFHCFLYFVGVECQWRQEVGGDEIYGSVMCAIPSTKATVTCAFPQDVPYWELGRVGDRIVSRNDLLWEGPPTDMSITGQVAEFDSGDIDKYKQRVASLAAAYVTGGASLASNWIEDVTKSEELAWVAGGWVEDAARWIEDFVISDVLGASDDFYAPQTLRLGWEEMQAGTFPLLTLARNDDPRELKYTHKIVLSGEDDGGDHGAYALYFRVVTEARVRQLP